MSGFPGPTEQYRRTRRLEEGWRFHQGEADGAADPEFDDDGWQSVEIPHDWSIEGPFDPEHPAGSAGAFLPGGVGWYRRSLPTDVDGGKVYLRFDGVYRDSDVYLGGDHVGNRPNGYTSFNDDVSQAEGGETLAVRVDNTDLPNCRWYSGSGIYRHVHLIETSPLHVVPWGTDVRTPAVTGRRARVDVHTEVANDAEEAAVCTLSTAVYDPSGEVVAETATERRLDAGEKGTFDQELVVTDPELWSPATPERYHVRSVVHRRDPDETGAATGEPVDDYVTPFGIRTVTFSADEGVLLNGDSLTLKGVNLHHSAGALGAAVPERALERRLETLAEMGVNAIRTAHNPPQPELLALCDRMGFLVIDEAFDKWRHEKTEQFFDEWWREDLAAMIRRDRNHPSVIAWSVGNESYDHGDEGMLDDLEMLVEAANDLDPTRPATYGSPAWGDGHEGILENAEAVAERVDLFSGNYMEHHYDELRERGVDIPIVGSECRPFFRGSGDDPLAFVPRNPWFDVAERADVAGQFIWAGFDYLGEAREWPSKGWPTGLIDTCGVPKPPAAFHRSVWSDEPMVEIAAFDPDRERAPARPAWSWPALSAHWTFPDREDSRGFVHVVTFTNAERVTLYQNDETIGVQHLADNPDHMIEWYVPYEPGTLRAVAETDGEVVATHELETAGEPARVDLDPDREAITADGQDLVYVDARIVDDDGVVVPRADHEIEFSVSGAGDLAGIDNGDLASDESYTGSRRSASHGTALAIVQADRESGEVTITADVDELENDEVTVPVRPPE
ncbi:beta-galactosidase protein [Halorhabdus tiamatea SARL4B]|uniref:Beta-galactosidase protein n=1 Tax=Halorhabdus tiamatea SARL4B TaxID=1033806 RepID=S6CTZ2_9EURY|nr:glycoside hydrolase family 2 TIM barrel-domain containing protein [Halorhabdus tiamatea]ERJ05962.1 beta-galactosidase protein [Halorhabdus tiamatea SARL4B]CCQ34004.1 beta-glucuronidase, family GH2 [Halorhabdus tiamatea SARL4B]